MNKKKFLVISIIVVFLLGIVLVQKNKRDVKNYFNQISTENQEKKLKKEIERKIYVKEFNTIISNLDLRSLKTVNYLTDRDSIKNILNNENGEKLMQRISSQDISVSEAESILITSRELTELQEVSAEVKAFLKEKYKDFDYEYFGKNGDKIIAYIRDRENVYSLLPEKLANDVKNSSILQAEKMKEILNGMEIPSKIDITTEQYFSLQLDYRSMEHLYLLSCVLNKIVEIIPGTKKTISEIYPNFDYTLILEDGLYFLEDKNSQDKIDSEYSSKEYSFKEPYVKVNPYNRVINSVIIKYPGIEKDNVKVTVKGRGDSQDLSYKIIKQNQLEIYGLFIGNEANIITLTRGKEEISIPITIEGLPNSMPVIITKKNENISPETGSEITQEKTLERSMIYTTYVNGSDSYGLIFDKNGYIRYLFNPNSANRTVSKYLKFEKNGFIYFDKQDVILFSKIGKVVSRMTLGEFQSKEENSEEIVFEKTGYPESTTKNMFEKNISVVTKGFVSKNYPEGLITILNSNNNETIFSAEIYFDSNDKNENSINSSEEIEFPN